MMTRELVESEEEKFIRTHLHFWYGSLLEPGLFSYRSYSGWLNYRKPKTTVSILLTPVAIYTGFTKLNFYSSKFSGDTTEVFLGNVCGLLQPNFIKH